MWNFLLCYVSKSCVNTNFLVKILVVWCDAEYSGQNERVHIVDGKGAHDKHTQAKHAIFEPTTVTNPTQYVISRPCSDPDILTQNYLKASKLIFS